MIPYLLIAFLYIIMAVLAALESSFSSLNLLPWFNGIVWLRVHFITLGLLTQLIFGVTPLLTATYYNLPRPTIQWSVWVTLNVGILLLLSGIPLLSPLPIISGGASIFIAAVLLGKQLRGMRPLSHKQTAGRPFYLAGLAYFLLGILVGTGLFLGWANPLHIVGSAVEVHIHANIWGLLSLVFAGLLVDLYPAWTKQPLANPRAITPIFWMMTVGAFALIVGPWFDNRYWLALGLVLHVAAILWLLYNIIRPLRGHKAAQTIGMAHLLTAYFWLLAPILAAPFVLRGTGTPPTAVIAQFAPQALVYGWVLQFGIAVVPYCYQRFLCHDEEASLGGTKASYLFINLGSAALWASIFSTARQETFYASAYLLWALALVALVVDVWQPLKKGIAT